MSKFRNVQSAGNWQPGGIYTFEVDENADGAETIEVQDPDSGSWVWDGLWENYYYDPNKETGQYFFSWYENWWANAHTVDAIAYAQWYVWTNISGDEWAMMPQGTPDASGYYLFSRKNSYYWVAGEGTVERTATKYFSLISLEDVLANNGEYPDGYYVPSGVGTILYDNNAGNQMGAVTGGLTILNLQSLEDGWVRYTVQVSSTLARGNYYLKGATYLVADGGAGGSVG
jgi:hypothetical protein